jgi:glycosyltransferase involved in cell wall biosynthesis
MRILIVLTYFQPHKSGLTVYAVREARALAAKGHEVTVLTSQYDPKLPLKAWDKDVRIIRMPVAFRISKGVIMPKVPFKAWRLLGEADIVNLHVPQVDAALVTLLAKLRHKPVVLTYHCDLRMPAGIINRLAGWAANLANRISANLADILVQNTQDFAEHSPFLKRYMDKLTVIQPPIVVEQIDEADIKNFRIRHNIQPNDRIIGIAARLATEKGVEYLVGAMPLILAAIPQARVFSVGDYQNVFGEEAYRDKLLSMISKLGNHWTFLGVISEKEKAIFYHVSEVLVLPSINSTESFGMVQVEALTCGTPVVATDLPGVRQPVLTTGMGEIVPVRDAEALAEAIIEVMENKKQSQPGEIRALSKCYSPENVAEEYEKLFKGLLK